MSKITVNTLAELQNEIGQLQKQTQRESFEKRFGIREAYSGPGTRAWADARDSRDKRVEREYNNYVARVEATSTDTPLEQWEWELLGYADKIL